MVSMIKFRISIRKGWSESGKLIPEKLGKNFNATSKQKCITGRTLFTCMQSTA